MMYLPATPTYFFQGQGGQEALSLILSMHVSKPQLQFRDRPAASIFQFLVHLSTFEQRHPE
jgi:hypothetical protein